MGIWLWGITELLLVLLGVGDGLLEGVRAVRGGRGPDEGEGARVAGKLASDGLGLRSVSGLGVRVGVGVRRWRRRATLPRACRLPIMSWGPRGVPVLTRVRY